MRKRREKLDDSELLRRAITVEAVRERRESPVLTISELARFLSVHTSTIYRLMKQNKLPGFKIGSDWRFHIREIEAWMAEQSRVQNIARGKQ